MAMQPWMDVVSTLETDFILRAVAEGIREDGRGLMERRPVSSMPSAPGRSKLKPILCAYLWLRTPWAGVARACGV